MPLARAFVFAFTLSLAVAAAGFAATPKPAQPARSMVELNAQARAEGNRREDAVQLGRTLLSTLWPAQILKIRVDGVGRHEVAGLRLSGVKFHGKLDEAGFKSEVAALVKQTFASSRVEEVDIWAVEPIPYDRLEPVSGDYAEPTDQVVFSITVRRSEKGSYKSRLKHGTNVFTTPEFRKRLNAGHREGGPPGSPNPESSPPST